MKDMTYPIIDHLFKSLLEWLGVIPLKAFMDKIAKHSRELGMYVNGSDIIWR